MKLIAVVLGTRPEVIKMAPVISQLRSQLYADQFEVQVISTGQHIGLFEDAMKAFNLKVDLDLALMESNQSISDLFIRAYRACTEQFAKSKPSLVVVHGDTGTSAAAALAAHHLKIPIAHVEAGLRSGDLSSPWPEESNRRIVDAISSIHFSPTSIASENLIKEGHHETVFQVGNSVVDALYLTRAKLENELLLPSLRIKTIVEKSTKPIIAVTQHRRENFGSDLENILSGIMKIASLPVEIIFPVHPNPAVNQLVKNLLGKQRNIHLIEPLDYHSMVYLMSNSILIVTDSGGIQEEAMALHIPVLVTRKNTERMEGIIAGGVKLVGVDSQNIFLEAKNLLGNESERARMIGAISPFGDGNSAEAIATNLFNYLR